MKTVHIKLSESAPIGETLVAYELCNALRDQGFDASVVSGGAPRDGYEIAVGYAEKRLRLSTAHGYAITGRGGQIRIAANSPYGYDAAKNAYLRLIESNDLPQTVSLVCDASETFDETAVSLLGKAGNLRVLFYNVYGWDGAGPIALRQQQQIELVRLYAPDVLGLQEYSASYRATVTPMLANIGYARVAPEQDKTSYTPLFYRTDSLDVLSCGSRLYPLTMVIDGRELPSNDVKSKSLTWAVFHHRASGNRFVAVCTHFMWSDPKNLTAEQANAIRVANAEQLLETVEEIGALNAAYRGLPVVMGGDLNCRATSEPNRVLQRGGFEWAYDLAERKHACGGMKGYPVYDAEKRIYVAGIAPPTDMPDQAIDYIRVKQGADEMPQLRVETYDTVTDRLALRSSDHCPKLADLTLY